MSIGRISGPMLKANLERQGIDLSVETNLLYVDVNNHRIGINQDVPTASLHVDNITIQNNQIRSVSGSLDLGEISEIKIFGGVDGYYLKTDGNGNLSFSEVDLSFTISDGSNTDVFSTGETFTFVGSLPIVTAISDNQVAISANDATVSTKGIASFDDESFSVTSGLVSVKAGGISNSQLAGSISNEKLVNSSITIGSSVIDLGSTTTDLIGLTSIDVDGISINENTIFSNNTNSDIVVSPNGTGQLIIQGTNAVTIPSGTSLERPSGTAGDIRVNQDTGNFEYYDGVEWKIITPSINVSTIDVFSGDDSTEEFTLSESTTTSSTIVTLNGVVQSPGNAYNISENVLTFTEAPKVGDNIEIRYISTAFTPGSQIAQLDTTVTVNDSQGNIISRINGSNVIVTTSTSTTISGSIIGIGSLASISTSVPTSNNDTGIKGEIAYDSSYVYICINTNTWVRSSIQTIF